MTSIRYLKNFNEDYEDYEIALSKVTNSLNTITLEDYESRSTTQIITETKYFDDGERATQVEYTSKYEERVSISHTEYFENIDTYDDDDNSNDNEYEENYPYVSHRYIDSYQDPVVISLGNALEIEDSVYDDNSESDNYYYQGDASDYYVDEKDYSLEDEDYYAYEYNNESNYYYEEEEVEY